MTNIWTSITLLHSRLHGSFKKSQIQQDFLEYETEKQLTNSPYRNIKQLIGNGTNHRKLKTVFINRHKYITEHSKRQVNGPSAK